jgi:hypothetical protein
MRREYQNQRSQLEEKKQSMMTNRSRGRVLDFLMRQKDSGHLPGIFGRLVSNSVSILSPNFNTVILAQKIN